MQNGRLDHIMFQPFIFEVHDYKDGYLVRTTFDTNVIHLNGFLIQSSNCLYYCCCQRKHYNDDQVLQIGFWTYFCLYINAKLIVQLSLLLISHDCPLPLSQVASKSQSLGQFESWLTDLPPLDQIGNQNMWLNHGSTCKWLKLAPQHGFYVSSSSSSFFCVCVCLCFFFNVDIPEVFDPTELIHQIAASKPTQMHIGQIWTIFFFFGKATYIVKGRKQTT